MTLLTSSFDLPDRLAAKADPALIAGDERHFSLLGESLARSAEELSVRLEEERRKPGGAGQEAMDRDLEIHRLSARLRMLNRFGLDLCLGRMVGSAGTKPVYIGRLGLTDRDGTRLLIDWRSPAAEPFFAATHADPMGLRSRRRYRWTGGRISDYWDEVFVPEALAGHAALDDQSAFIASLGGSRSPRMRDVLGTIQADQDAIIRAGSRGALVVDGGPGTGKTVVALHRAAFLLHSDARLVRGGRLLFVGPHEAYLAYVEDVLPSLGEESVQLCTLRDLVRGGEVAPEEADPEVAALKASARLVDAVEEAVRFHERPPARELSVATPWGEARLDAAGWADAFDAADAASSHNEAREEVWEEILALLGDQLGEEAPPHLLGRALQQDEDLMRAFGSAWPLLDSAGVIADLWSIPGYLRSCAPWLDEGEVRLLQREDARAWTASDLPFLDAARRRVGDPEASRRRRMREASLANQLEVRDRVIDDLVAADDSDLLLMRMLRGQDARNSLVDESALPETERDLLAGPFAHIVVDEAQELTDAQWRMLRSRCPSGSFTIVGDRGQARQGFVESWEERLGRVGLGAVSVRTLGINYRTPREVMAEAEPVIRSALPDANVPTSVRVSGIPVGRGSVEELDSVVEAWLAEHPEGTACVIGAPGFRTTSPRVRSASPELVKGLEFDLVVLVDPERFGGGITGAVDRYVAMTRATRRLVILTSRARD